MGFLSDLMGRRFTKVPITPLAAHELTRVRKEQGATLVDLRDEDVAGELVARGDAFRQLEAVLKKHPVIFVAETFEEAMAIVGRAGFRAGKLYVASAADAGL